MFRIMFEAELEEKKDTENRTIEEINKAIEQETGIADWFSDTGEFIETCKEGFTDLEENKVIIYEDAN